MLAERRREGFVTRGYPSGPGVGRTCRASRLGPQLSRDQRAGRGFRLRKAGLFLQRGALVGKTYLDVCLVGWGIGGGLEGRRMKRHLKPKDRAQVFYPCAASGRIQ